jgi:hypothetical protein
MAVYQRNEERKYQPKKAQAMQAAISAALKSMKKQW